MYPLLLELGPIKIHTYGLLVASGFLLGIFWAGRLGEKEGMDREKIHDTAFWILISAIVFSRVVYIIVNLDYYLKNPLSAFKIWEGGLVFYGGVIGAIIAGEICVRKYKLDRWAFADVIAPAAALGHSLGRLGCFFAGCCYGQPTDVAWAVTFSNIQNMAPVGIPIHPTQIYDALNEFTIFLILTLIRNKRRFKGQIFFLWIALYAVGRAIVEAFRDDPRGSWLNDAVSTSQLIAVVAIVASIIFMLRNRKLYPINSGA